ncbi:MAG: hypothetical protein HC858_03715, partial [Brachymonas sp.]|nr:hypothetical protein [Brachymonas sp.]
AHPLDHALRPLDRTRSTSAPSQHLWRACNRGNAALWSTTYNGASPTVPQAGNRFAFTAAQPTGVAIAASDVVKTYGQVVDFSNAALGNGYTLVSTGSGASFGNAFTDVGFDVSGITLTGAPVLTSLGAAGTARRDGGINSGATYTINIDASGVTASNSAGAVTLDAPISGILTINPANATVTANSGSLTYNGTQQSVSSLTASGLVNGETISVLTGVSATDASGTNVGSYANTVSGSDVNYNLTFVNGNLNITPAALTVTANNDSRTYNGTNYSGVNNTGGAGVSYSGFVNNETVNVLGGSLTYGGTAQGSRNAGTFSISASGLTANNGNYTINYVDGQLVTNKTNATLSASSDSRQYNGFAGSNAAPSAIGIVAGDSVNLSQAFDSANAGNRTLSISSYAINDGNGGNNYNVNLQSASGTITPASLTITANNASMLQGQTVPLLTASYLGLVGNDTASNFGTPAVLNTAGSSTSPQGSYAITPSGASSPNYIVSYVNGQLTISPAPIPPVIVQPPSPPAPAPAPAPSPVGSPPAGSPPAPAPAPASAPAPATEGTQSAGNASGSNVNSNVNNEGNENNNSFSFTPETEEQKANRLRRLGKLFTIVGGGVKE